MAAMANSIGNKSLNYSKYESYKTVKLSEQKVIGRILIEHAKKAKSKSDDQKLYLKETIDKTANPLWQCLNMLLAFKTWKRYADKYDLIGEEKDEVDIDSTDFVLEEFEEERAKYEKTLKIRNKLKAEKEKRSKRNSRNSFNNSRNSSNKSHRRGSTMNGMPMSRDPSKRPTLVLKNPDQGGILAQKISLLDDQMDNLEKVAIAHRQATIEQQIVDEKSHHHLHDMPHN